METTQETESGIQLFASVQNEGVIDRETLLSIDLGDTLFDSRRLTVPAGSTVNATWNLPAGTATIEARLSEHEGDFLPLDDVAWAVHEGGVSNRTLMVTEGNLFLEQVFTVLPGIEAFKVPPGSDLLAAEDFDYDLVIFDGVALPDPPPAADMLIINPQAGGEGGLFSVNGTFSNTITTQLEESSLLQFVAWNEVDVRQAQRVSAPWAQTLVQAEGGPLVQIGEQNGRRIAILTFDLRDSDLPLQIAFPILMANITGWLSPGRAFDAPTGLQPGDPVAVVPGASSTAVLVEKPDGSRWSAEVGEEDLFFTETDAPGLYTVLLRDAAADRAAGSFAVNLFSAAESAIRPADDLPIGQTVVDTEEEGNVGQRELWPWLLAIAVIILIVEWWVHHRGTRWPKLPTIANRFR